MNCRSTDPDTWTIVLAAGEGTRLQSLTRDLHGEALPKQFAFIRRHESLLQSTLLRTSRFAPMNRTVVVVAEDRELLARRQVQAFHGLDLVAQPSNLGTGPGLLLPLARVMARDPEAMVVVTPADHYVRDAGALVRSVDEARSIAKREDALVLVAAEPEGPETGYGWIRTAVTGTGGAAVASFVEKPSERVAGELFAAGALWNTFVMVGSARRFWALAQELLPCQSMLFDVYRQALGFPRERRVLENLYRRMQPADFSRDVLERAEALRVVRLAPCGWSDWGTPERVLRSLRELGEYNAFVARLRGQHDAFRPEPATTFPAREPQVALAT